MSGFLSPTGIQKFFDNNGNPLALGVVTSYQAGSTTQQPTYTDSTLATPNPNPLTLNFRGEAQMWLPANTAYKFNVQDANGNQLPGWPVDQIQVPLSILTQAGIGATLYPITAAETAAGVAPTAYQYPPYDVRRYGMATTGTAGANLAALNSAFLAASFETAATVTGAPGTYPMSGPIILDTNKVGFEGNGCTLNLSAYAAGNVWQPFQSAVDTNLRGPQNTAHSLRNFNMQGPGCQNAAVIAVYLNDTTGAPNQIAGVTFRNVGFMDFGQDVIFANGANFSIFDNCFFTATVAGSSGGGTTYSVQQTTCTNGGERNTFLNCTWTNKAYIAQNAYSNADVYISHCSFDGFITALDCTGGAIYCDNIHMENSTDSNWGIAAGGSIIIEGLWLVTQVAVKALDYFTSSNIDFGVFLRDVFFGPGANTITGKIIGGTGLSRISGLIQFPAGAQPTLSTWQSTLAYGAFENANWANDWVLTGTHPPTRSFAQNHTPSGTASMLLAPIVGDTVQSRAAQQFPCAPGQYIQGEIWYLLLGLTGTGATFEIIPYYFDASGGALAAPASTFTVTVGAWTKLSIKMTNPAPAGTASGSLQIICTVPTAGAPLCYVDDIICGVA